MISMQLVLSVHWLACNMKLRLRYAFVIFFNRYGDRPVAMHVVHWLIYYSIQLNPYKML